MNLNDATPFIAGPVIGLLSLGLAYLAYKRGAKADDVAADTAAAAQVYAGYGGLLQRIQDDNADLRIRLKQAEDRLAAAEQRITLLLEKLGEKGV